MDKLDRILRRSHCCNTHHLIAIDALQYVQTPGGKRLVTWLKRYHHQYLKGAADPDTRICDFQNQIIHVEDGFWGGGPRVARQWYNRLLQFLAAKRYGKAAEAAGILSHYFVDALQPLHTGETRREAVVHAPLERSVYYSYDEIRQHWNSNPLREVFHLPDGNDWLRESMLQGAKYAHRRFSLLVNSYRFDAGIDDPLDGLNEVSRAALAELLGRSVTGWARVIERAAQDSENLLRHPLPVASRTIPLALAVAGSPFRWWRRRSLECLEDRRIKALATEYRRKGYLRKHLPDEVDIKQRVNQVRRDEKIYQKALAKRAQERQNQRSDAEADIVRGTTPAASMMKRQPVVPIGSEQVRPIDGRLMVAAGCFSSAQAARSEAAHLYCQLLRVSMTELGQRVLRGKAAPTLQDVRNFIDQAKAKLSETAA
jgi:hypothetical protein